MTLKAVIYDVGGTLIKYPVPLTEMGQVFEEYKDEVGLSLEEAKEWFEAYMNNREFGIKTMREATFLSALMYIAEKYELTINKREMMNILRFMYDRAFKDKAELIVGAKEILEYCKSRGLSRGLISNTAWPAAFHEEDLKRFGILNHFDSRIWTSEDGLRKPHKTLFLKMLRQLGVNSSEAIYIGDTFSRDVIGPNGIGIPAILISSEPAPHSFNGEQVSNLSEALELIVKMS